MATSEDSDLRTELVVDRSGHSMRLTNFRGDRLPPFPPESFRRLETFQFRDDDILISAYPKSGTHWVWEMVRMLQEGKIDLPVVEKDDNMIEYTLPTIVKMPSPRTLNTHLLFRQLPGLSKGTGCKILYITRNPRDTAVSFFHHHKKMPHFYQYGGSWDDYFHLFVDGKMDYGSWFDYTRDWEEVFKAHPELQVLRLNYEDMKENPEEELTRISRFVGYERDEAFIQSVVAACDFASMRSRKGQIDVCPEGTPVMYRKGEVGDWQNWFTAQQVLRIEEVYKSKLAGIPLSFRYTL